MTFQVEIIGLEQFADKLHRMGVDLEPTVQAAAMESVDEIIKTEGLKKYPPKTAANRPGRMKTVKFSNGTTAEFRMPYYERGTGLYVPVRGGGYKTDKGSDSYGTKWASKKLPYGAQAINSAKYAIYLGGDKQPSWAAAIGWRKLKDVGTEKMGKINSIFNAWINRLIKKVGLL